MTSFTLPSVIHAQNYIYSVKKQICLFSFQSFKILWEKKWISWINWLMNINAPPWEFASSFQRGNSFQRGQSIANVNWRRKAVYKCTFGWKCQIQMNNHAFSKFLHHNDVYTWSSIPVYLWRSASFICLLNFYALSFFTAWRRNPRNEERWLIYFVLMSS